MKLPQIITVLALTAIMAVITIPALAQQSSSTPMTQDPQQQQQAQPQTPDSQASSSAMAQTQTFQGTISRSKGQYVLTDSASGASYKLDDQKKAKEFVGKSVKITGTPDSSGKTIHVSSIEPGA
jgi:uncharacterized protein YdeI (BOF family)